MITYKYSLIRDVKFFLHNRRNRKQRKEREVYLIKFSLLEYLKLLSMFWTGKLNLPALDVEEDIICYIVSSGTWGAYELPNKILICPLKLEWLQMSLEELILHEIVHLRLEEKTKGKSFEEREDLINEEVKKITKNLNL